MADSLLCWFDIPVLDLDRAARFYSAVLGSEVSPTDMGGGFMIAMITSKSGEPAGCLHLSEEVKPSDQGTLIYFTVAGRLRAAVTAVQANGGTVQKDVHPIGPYGFRAVVLDTEGNRLALHSEKDD